MSPTEWLTLALVVVTAYYAIQTRKTVKAMEHSTRAQQMPHLALQLTMPGADEEAAVRVRNEGQGPAIDPSLTVEFIPPPGSNIKRITRAVRVTLIPVGMGVLVSGPERSDGESMTHDEVCASYEKVSLTGTVTDSLKSTHQVDSTLEELRPFSRSSERQFTVEPHPRVNELFQIRRQLILLHASLRKIESAIRGDPDDVPF